MKKTVRQLMSIILLLGLLAPVSLVYADTGAAVAYLQNQPSDAWATMALVAAGQTPTDLEYLKNVSGSAATDYAKAILALAAAGKNPTTFGHIDYVAKLKSYYVAGQFGADSLLNDDIWSALALGSVGLGQATEAIGAKQYLLSHQNSDGGWGYAVNGSSDSNDTAAALMALRETGVASDDPAIVAASNYLKTVQNADGGFGYQLGNDSDAGSDAWVISAIYALNQDPAAWLKNDRTPLDHLLGLQDSDGGFWWLAPGASGNNKAMTAFAVIALSGKSYPVGRVALEAPVNSAPGTRHLRLEGKNQTLCDVRIVATTALDIMKQAAGECGYTYTITESNFGDYLSAINTEAAAGMSGWLYLVNNQIPDVGAGDYQLADGDDVVWYFGDWGWTITRLHLDRTSIEVNQSVHAAAQYFNGTDWLPLPNAVIAFGNNTTTANGAGEAEILFNQVGAFTVYVNTPGFIRGAKATVTVGAATAQTIGLQAEIVQGVVNGDSIMLIVSPNLLNFGALRPGQAHSQALTLQNGGTDSLVIRASVAGDDLFTQQLKINATAWQSFSQTLAAQTSVVDTISLGVPAAYLGSGIKRGELVIWAETN